VKYTWLLIFMIGCGDELGAPPRFADPECPELQDTPCDIRELECTDRLFRIAACLRGDQAGDAPPIKVITEAELETELLRRAEEMVRPNPDRWEIALTLLGLAVPGALQPRDTVEEATHYIAGYYNAETKEIVIVDHGNDSFDEASNEYFIHEALHALQDKGDGITALLEAHDDTQDALLAALSLIEGEARVHQSRYLAYRLGLDVEAIDWTRRFQEAIELDEEWVLMQPSKYTAGGRAFPYEWGARYIHFVRETEGQAGVLQRFASPPGSSHALMASIDSAFAPELTPTTPPPSANPDEWALVSRATLGAWYMHLAFAHDSIADNFALNWRGDQLFVYANTVDMYSTAVVWKIDLADEASAEASVQLSERALSTAVVGRQGSRVVITVTDSTSSLAWALE
jgi:hypothetical protein